MTYLEVAVLIKLRIYIELDQVPGNLKNGIGIYHEKRGVYSDRQLQ